MDADKLFNSYIRFIDQFNAKEAKTVAKFVSKLASHLLYQSRWCYHRDELPGGLRIAKPLPPQ